jgi:hypothetical protein
MPKRPGVTYHIDDKDSGPFTLRISGTNKFVSFIEAGPSFVGLAVDTVVGWNNKSSLVFSTLAAALSAADLVWEISDYCITIEPCY